MEQERPRPPGGGGGGGGFERPSGGGGGGPPGESGLGIIVIVVLVIAYLAGDSGYGGNAPMEMSLSIALTMLTSLLALLTNRNVKTLGLKVQPEKVMIVCILFIVTMYFSDMLPLWLSQNIWALAAVLRMAMLFGRTHLVKVGIDMPEVVFATDAFLLITVLGSNVGFVGEILGKIVNIISNR